MRITSLIIIIIIYYERLLTRAQSYGSNLLLNSVLVVTILCSQGKHQVSVLAV